MIRLNHYSIWIYFLDQFLGSLRQHIGLVHCANQEHFFTIKPLSQVHKSWLEAIHPKLNQNVKYDTLL